ncbi:ParA family protein [Ligilactobacillus sp. LYQ139]|uniref:ParA family protein n=1 Tax=Ligilactobacillus sp. LYQ139 TaxID=3378800 RepID=UPI003853F3AF
MRHKTTQFIAFGGIKGGVGKTSLLWNYAAFLAKKGLPVLMVDCDPQRGLTALAGSLNTAMNSEQNVDLIFTSNYLDCNVQIITQNSTLLPGNEVLPNNGDSRYFVKWLQYIKLQTEYQVVLFDTSSGLNELNDLIFAHMDQIIDVITPDSLSIVANTEFQEHLARITVPKNKIVTIGNKFTESTLSHQFQKALSKITNKMFLPLVPDFQILEYNKNPLVNVIKEHSEYQPFIELFQLLYK